LEDVFEALMARYLSSRCRFYRRKKMELIEVQPTEEQSKWCREYLSRNNLGNRGEFDGDKFQQFFGLLAQVIIVDRYGLPRPAERQESDGGYDVTIDGTRYDVKCRKVNCPYRPHYPHNLKASQVAYDCDGYIFTAYNTRDGVFTICGAIKKEDFLRLAQYFKEGEKRLRDDGKYMIVKGTGGMYELENKYLGPLPVKKRGQQCLGDWVI
jgi:hypothetical protein